MNAVKFYRKKANLSQEQLAEQLGVDRSTVTKWETKENLPRANKLLHIARILGCGVDELLQETDL